MDKTLLKKALENIKTDFTGIKGKQAPDIGAWVLVLFVIVNVVNVIVRKALNILEKKYITQMIGTTEMVLIIFVAVFFAYYEIEKIVQEKDNSEE